MVKCANCGTGWTSSGLPLCPVCGTKVPVPAAPARHTEPEPEVAAPLSAPEAAVRKNGSAVLEVPPELRKAEPREESCPYMFPQLKRIEPAPLAEPTPAPLPAVKQEKPEEPSSHVVPQLKRVQPPPVAEPMPPSPPVVKKEKPVDLEEPVLLHRLQRIDASAANFPVQAPAAARELPAPARPLNGPIILGALAFVPALVLPMTLAFESTRVLGVLGFCMSGFFAPFAPIAWMVGLSAEKRRREQALRPERRVSIGRLLGQGATLILVAEMTMGLIAIAALRLSGKFPTTFWSLF